MEGSGLTHMHESVEDDTTTTQTLQYSSSPASKAYTKQLTTSDNHRQIIPQNNKVRVIFETFCIFAVSFRKLFYRGV